MRTRSGIIRRLVLTAAVSMLLLVAAVPVAANEGNGSAVWPAGEWGNTFVHENPCTGETDTVEGWWQFHGVTTDKDGDGNTTEDANKNLGVSKLLSATHTNPDFVVVDAGNALIQHDTEPGDLPGALFADDDQGQVTFRKWLKAENPETGEWYTIRTLQHWVMSGQGEIVLDESMYKSHSSGCKG
jgi:hypothetical protein